MPRYYAQWGWARCPYCGIQTHAIQWHICDQAVEQAELFQDFDQEFVHEPRSWHSRWLWRWLPYEEWLTTPAGRFAIYQTERFH